MVECHICGESLERSGIECSICGREVHRRCAKKRSGDWYCKECKKKDKAKEKSRYEKMARRDRSFSGGKPGGR